MGGQSPVCPLQTLGLGSRTQRFPQLEEGRCLQLWSSQETLTPEGSTAGHSNPGSFWNTLETIP